MKTKKYNYGNLDNQLVDFRIPDRKGPHPVVIVIQGGYWQSDVGLVSIGSLVEKITKQRIVTWSIEYCRVGQVGGGWPGTFTDIALAINYLPELAKSNNLDLNRVLLVGHSAGGQLALWLAGRHRLPLESEIKNDLAVHKENYQSVMHKLLPFACFH